MTTPSLFQNIESAEGCCLHGYPDPDSPLGKKCQLEGVLPIHFRNVDNWQTLSGSPWTIGYGSTGQGIGPDTVWTQQQADAALASKVLDVRVQLSKVTPWWTKLDQTRQDAFAELAYNLGVTGWTKGFKNTVLLIQQGKYEEAAGALSSSVWAKEVSATRATRIIDMIRNG